MLLFCSFPARILFQVHQEDQKMKLMTYAKDLTALTTLFVAGYVWLLIA